MGYLEFNKESLYNKVVFYIHGGPDYFIQSVYDDPYVEFLFKIGIHIVVINYPYVPGSGGNLDLSYIVNVIDLFKNKNSKDELIVIGESYGGYLATLLNQYYGIVDKIISISSFISLEYQYLFSTERIWLQKYIDYRATDFLHTLTLINNIKIIFINGYNDPLVPIAQFSVINNKKDGIFLYKLKDYKHRESGTKLNKIKQILINFIMYNK